MSTIFGYPVVRQNILREFGMRYSFISISGTELQIIEYREGNVGIEISGSTARDLEFVWDGWMGIVDTLLTVPPWHWRDSKRYRVARIVKRLAGANANPKWAAK